MGVDARRLRDAVQLLLDTATDSTFQAILDPEAVDGISDLFGEAAVLESGVPRMGGGITVPVAQWLAETSHLLSQVADGVADEGEDEIRDDCRELAAATKVNLGTMDPIEFWVRGAARTLRGMDCPDSEHLQFLADQLEAR